MCNCMPSSAGISHFKEDIQVEWKKRNSKESLFLCKDKTSKWISVIFENLFCKSTIRPARSEKKKVEQPYS